jgi:streptomycin 6-kinase
VLTADGGEQVLKVAWAHEESRDEAAGMRAWQGHGAARLFRSERRGDTAALLLERVRPGVPLARSLTWPERDEVLASVLLHLRVPVRDLVPAQDGGPDAPFRPLSGMCAWWADRAQHRAEAGGSPLPQGLVEHGLGLFRELPQEWDGDPVLLATDLNPGNLLSHDGSWHGVPSHGGSWHAGSSRGASSHDGPSGWLLIDPKPYVGDPHYDVLQHMLNDQDRLTVAPSAFADRMADLAGLDRRRTRRWLLARCVQEAGAFEGAATAAQRLVAEGVE